MMDCVNHEEHKVSMIRENKKARNIHMARRLSILKQPIFSTFNNHLIDYPTPSNISYWWSFGSLAGLCLSIQIITGVFLAIHCTPHVELAFLSVEHFFYYFYLFLLVNNTKSKVTSLLISVHHCKLIYLSILTKEKEKLSPHLCKIWTIRT